MNINISFGDMVSSSSGVLKPPTSAVLIAPARLRMPWGPLILITVDIRGRSTPLILFNSYPNVNSTKKNVGGGTRLRNTAGQLRGTSVRERALSTPELNPNSEALRLCDENGDGVLHVYFIAWLRGCPVRHQNLQYALKQFLRTGVRPIPPKDDDPKIILKRVGRII